MKKTAIVFVVIIAAFLIISCPGVTDPPDDTTTDATSDPVLSSDATLAGLTVTTGAIDHVYTTVESTYSLTVSNAVDSITVAPVLSGKNAHLKINNIDITDISITIPVSVGVNTITMVVTAEDGETTLSYSVVITRLDDTAPADTTPPVITLNGDNPLSMEVNTTFTDPGYSALDDIEGDLTSAVVVAGAVDTATVGTYTVTYNVSDTSGNTAIEVTRTVNVMEPLEAPVINLASGTYTSAQTVTITHPNPDVTIKYTLDNTWIPYNDDSVGSVYSGEITVSTPTTLIARAFLDGFNSSSVTSADYAIVSSGENNLVANGDFNYGKNLWNSYAINGAAADFEVTSGGAYHISITNGSTEMWHVQTTYQLGVNLEQGKSYRLSFDAKADSNRNIVVWFQEYGVDHNGDGNAYSIYGGRLIDIGTSWDTYTFTFIMHEATDNAAKFVFCTGSDNADVYLDNIILTEIVPTILTETDVPDANLRAAFEDATGKSFTGVSGGITDMDLAGLDELKADGVSITNLTGLEYCDNVYFLLLNNNDLSGTSANLSVISQMDNLKAIDLWGCNLQNLDFLSGLSHIEHIKVCENPDLSYSDILSLNSSNFPDLLNLSIGALDTTGDGNIDQITGTDWNDIINMIGGYSRLAELTLHSFGCTTQMVTQLTDVLAANPTIWKRLSLSYLTIFGNSGITDLSWVTGMNNIEYLEFRENTNITDLTPLKTLYNNGGFNTRAWGSIDLDITNCNLDLTSGTSNRDVVDYLISHGVRVDYEEGNTTDNGSIDITIQ